MNTAPEISFNALGLQTDELGLKQGFTLGPEQRENAPDVTDADAGDVVTIEIIGVSQFGAGVGIATDEEILAASRIINPEDGSNTIIGEGETGGQFALQFDGFADARFDAIPRDQRYGISFEIQVTDSQGATDVRTLTLLVFGENQGPAIEDQVLETTEGAAISGRFDAFDPEGDAFTIRNQSLPENGRIEFNPLTGEFTYTPNENFFGTEEIFIVSEDSRFAGDSAILTIHVAPVNDAPVITAPEPVTLTFGRGAGAVVADIDGTDVEDGADLHFAITDGDENDVFTIDAETGVITVADALAAARAEDPFTLEITATDSEGASDVAEVTVTPKPPANAIFSDDFFIFGTDEADVIIPAHGGVVFAKDGDDTVLGSAGREKVFAGDGADEAQGGAGRDTLFGQQGEDTLKGGADDDSAYGGHGDDLLFGDAGRDKLFGGTGADTLNGGAGDDKLFGGFGADLFAFDEGFGNDKIFDFNADHDRIQLFDGAEFEILEYRTRTDILVEGEGLIRIYGATAEEIAASLTGDDAGEADWSRISQSDDAVI